MSTDTATPEAPGLPDDTVVYEDYWGTDEKKKWYLPDGRQYFEFQIMNEGQKARFQKMTSQDLRVQGRTGDAVVSVDQAKERHELIKASVTGWHFFKGGESVLFSPHNLNSWLEKAPVKLVEDLEFEIRMANPWLQQEMSLEKMQEERERLDRMIAEKEKEDLGEGRS